MGKPSKRAAVLGAILALCLLCLSCTNSNNRPPRPTFECMGFPTLAPNLPFDVDVPDHPNVQCFAWQEFIALNWPALAGQAGVPDRSRLANTWGDASDTTPTVWETYKEAHEIFLPNAATPAPWNRRDLMRSFATPFKADTITRGLEARQLTLQNLPDAQGLQVLRLKSKVSPRLSQTQQAFGGTLTGQNGKLTYYSIAINRKAFDYIVGARLYDAAEQLGTAIDFPVGRTGLGPEPAQEGAIIVKSAWLDLTGYTPIQRLRFHTVEACLVEEDACRWTEVGLVGLHILQKTETFGQWTWATFEQVNNAPDREEVRRGSAAAFTYNYYNPRCSAADCPPNAQTTAPNPNQVVRVTPLSEHVQRLNRQIHDQIRAVNPDSVWQFYRLIDVQWPEAGAVRAGTAPVPLEAGAPRPSQLANVTLETFVQRRSCLDCHRSFATIADSGGTGHSQNADFTFLLGLARERQ
ncbi:MAG: hypothetical protein AAGF23_04010 [Acidobacteriota bacterium]